MKFRLFASAALLPFIALPGTAHAQDWYLGIKGGITFPRDTRFDQRGGPQGLFSTDSKKGYSIGGQLGHDMGLLRLETDIYYQRSKLRRLNNASYTPILPLGQQDAGGIHQSWNLMINALFDIINTDRITLSIGGGAGAVNNKVKNYQPAGQAAFLSDDDWVFGYQGLAGIRFAMNDSVDLTLDYRYAQSNRSKFTDRFGTPVDAKFKSHAALVGIAFKFGGGDTQMAAAEPVAPPPPAAEPSPPPPPPTPMPEPVPVQTGPYVVFFDWNDATITPEAQTILRNAAAGARASGQATLVLTGYADRSGSDQYNEGLSQRRTEAVKAFLMQEGVPAESMTTNAFGERNSPVETADGVREPQNRRVEIKISAMR